MSGRKVVVTGAGGFIGRALMERLKQTPEWLPCGVVRSARAGSGLVAVGDLGQDVDWTPVLDGAHAVVHLAGRAHQLKETASDPMVQFRLVNVDASVRLAAACAKAGVERFVFMSSIGVNGPSNQQAFTESTPERPQAPYAVSKWEAERAVKEVLAGTSTELVIIRPPLVYAADAPGNFARLLKLVALGLPLPLGAVHNQRSLVALENLVDFILLALDHPAAANELFLVADGVDLSTAELVKHLAEGLGRRPWLAPVPVALLEHAARWSGRSGMFEQLCKDLTVDVSKARNLLEWTPVLAPEQALRQAGAAYRAKNT